MKSTPRPLVIRCSPSSASVCESRYSLVSELIGCSCIWIATHITVTALQVDR